MTQHTHFSLQCSQSECGFRFPINKPSSNLCCPKCGAEAILITNQISGTQPRKDMNEYPISHIEALFDNIRSAYNVGSMIRSADGCGIRRIHLCGMTPTPDNSRVAKTALGAEYAVPWTYYPDAISTAKIKKEDGYQVWALEECQHSISLFESLEKVADSPILLIVGNEVHGVGYCIKFP